MTDTFSWKDRALLSCFAGWWGNMGTEHYPAGRDGPGMSCWVMWRSLANLQCLNQGSPEPSVSAEESGPLKALGLRVTSGAFLLQVLRLLRSFNTADVLSIGSWASYSFQLCCPRAGAQNPMGVGIPHDPALCCAPGPEALGLLESAISIPSAYCDPRAG